MNGLDLFSGIGGITIALQEWVSPVAYCEIDRYARAVLLSRMSEGELPIAPIWDDVRTLKKTDLPTEVDIITGGFPCQDISVAGRGAGLEGERSGLFFEIMRLTDELRPNFIFLENVPAITTRGGLRVTAELAARGYDCRWCIVSAADVGAWHKRCRWWLLAHTMRQGLQGQRPGPIFRSEKNNASGCDTWWSTEPDVVRVVHGLPFRAHRIKGLGNSVVPKQAREAFMTLSGLKK